MEFLDEESRYEYEKGPAFVDIAQYYFTANREEKALCLLERATSIADAIDDEDLKEEIAIVYEDNNYQHIARKLLPKNFTSAKQYQYSRYSENYKLDPIVLKAYSLVENSKYNEALDFIDSFNKTVVLRRKTVVLRANRDLLEYISGQYDCYIALGYRKKAAEVIDHKIKLVISIIQRIINQGLILEENFFIDSKNILIYDIYLLIRTAKVYFKEDNKYVDKQHILQQMKELAQNIKEQIKEIKLAFQGRSIRSDMMLVNRYDDLGKCLYENYLVTKNYQEALLMKEEIVDDFDRVEFLSELAVKLSQAS